MARETPVVLDPVPVELDRDAVLDRPPFTRWLDAPSGSATAASVDRLLQPVREAVTPRAVYDLTSVSALDLDGVDLPEELLAGSHLVLGALTLEGSGAQPVAIDSKIDAVVLDALENVVLQAAREPTLEAVLDTVDAEGFETTRALEPGGKEWALEGRGFVFGSLPTDAIDLDYRDGSPEPEKTLAFAIGAGPTLEGTDVLFSCGDCPIVERCVYAGAATAAP